MLDIARVLKHRHGRRGETGADPAAARTGWCASRHCAIRRCKQILPELGKPKNATSEKARRLLGWAPRSNEEAIVATAESLVRLGLLKESPAGSKDIGH